MRDATNAHRRGNVRRLNVTREDSERPVTNAWLDLVDVTAADQLIARWKASMLSKELRAPVGLRTNAEFTPAYEPEVVWVDLSDPRDGGDGIHAVVVGRGGAGKTELVRTWLTGLAALHSPDRVQFLLADPHWASFSGLESLPHTACSLKGLASDEQRVLALVEVLNAEVGSRLGSIEANIPYADGCNTIRGYRRLAMAGQTRPIPDLIVVVDDVDELALTSVNRALYDTLREVARVGSAVGIHLVLCTRGTESFPSQLLVHVETNIVVGEQDASTSGGVFGLSAVAGRNISPGCGYFRTDREEPYPFRAFTSEGQRSTVLCELMSRVRPATMPGSQG